MRDADRLVALVAEALQLPAGSLGPDSASAELDEWDSLGHLQILMRVEDEFGISVDMEAAGELASISELLGYIERKRR